MFLKKCITFLLRQIGTYSIRITHISTINAKYLKLVRAVFIKKCYRHPHCSIIISRDGVAIWDFDCIVIDVMKILFPNQLLML